jgi:hypothetical protein
MEALTEPTEVHFSYLSSLAKSPLLGTTDFSLFTIFLLVCSQPNPSFPSPWNYTSVFCAQPALLAWRWRQHVTPKCPYTSIRLHDVTSQKKRIFVVTTVTTSNITCFASTLSIVNLNHLQDYLGIKVKKLMLPCSNLLTHNLSFRAFNMLYQLSKNRGTQVISLSNSVHNYGWIGYFLAHSLLCRVPTEITLHACVCETAQDWINQLTSNLILGNSAKYYWITSIFMQTEQSYMMTYLFLQASQIWFIKYGLDWKNETHLLCPIHFFP